MNQSFVLFFFRCPAAKTRSLGTVSIILLRSCGAVPLIGLRRPLARVHSFLSQTNPNVAEFGQAKHEHTSQEHTPVVAPFHESIHSLPFSDILRPNFSLFPFLFSFRALKFTIFLAHLEGTIGSPPKVGVEPYFHLPRAGRPKPRTRSLFSSPTYFWSWSSRLPSFVMPVLFCALFSPAGLFRIFAMATCTPRWEICGAD